jgi:RimJ/RimL family protein N-acetyltransferase
MNYTVRPIRAHEWREVQALRLEALQDEAAPIAFLESYAEIQTRPDEFWQARAHAASSDAGPDAGARQFIAVDESGHWVGSAVAIVEEPGGQDLAGRTIAASSGQIVGVYLRPDHRGRGVMQELFEGVLHWMRERGLLSARLYVHLDNVRARAAYEKSGFRATGASFRGPAGEEIEMARVL